jgi:hypothetical protein
MVNWFELLSKGERKALGAAKEGAAALLRDPALIGDLLQVLEGHPADGKIVSHGFYVLKDASLENDRIRTQALGFCKAHLHLFTQFEARENFLRIALIQMSHDQQLWKMAAPMAQDTSAIVAAYASEYCLRYVACFDPDHLNQTFETLEAQATRAAVRARIRKLAAELGRG